MLEATSGAAFRPSSSAGSDAHHQVRPAGTDLGQRGVADILGSADSALNTLPFTAGRIGEHARTWPRRRNRVPTTGRSASLRGKLRYLSALLDPAARFWSDEKSSGAGGLILSGNWLPWSRSDCRRGLW